MVPNDLELDFLDYEDMYVISVYCTFDQIKYMYIHGEH
jgi:hypothetical protein